MSPASGTPWVKWVILLAIAAGLVYVFIRFPLSEWLSQQLIWIEQMGSAGYIWFVGLYVVATVVGFPASVLTLGAGAVYGVVTGSLLVVLGATLGATAAFLVGRYLARGLVERRVATQPRFAAVDRAVGRAGFKMVLLTRLSPVFPFVVLNYAFGITQVKLQDYFWASLIGMLPGTVLYVYLGSIAAAVATGDAVTSPVRTAATAAGLVMTIVVTIYVTRVARQALRDVEGVSA